MIHIATTKKEHIFKDNMCCGSMQYGGFSFHSNYTSCPQRERERDVLFFCQQHDQQVMLFIFAFLTHMMWQFDRRLDCMPHICLNKLQWSLVNIAKE